MASITTDYDRKNGGGGRMRKLPMARNLPLEVGVIHLVGIGGIGMSGIAEILHNLGYKVQGSDMSENQNVQRLREMGIDVKIGQRAENIENADILVKSTAVSMDNEEIVAAQAKRIPVIRRSDMLAELVRLKMSIAIAGTHGKTTTTSLTAALLEAANFNPTVINGGIINAYNTNAKLGKGEWLVVEADESDGTFIKLPASIAVVTNIDSEHLDHYGSFDNLRAAFAQFIDNLPFYGFAVMCTDHAEVQSLVAKITDRRVITYGTNPQADIRAVNIRSDKEGQYCDIEINLNSDTAQDDDILTIEPQLVKDIFLPMHGKHNLMNALAAFAVASELNISYDIIRKAFAEFSGVKRRFTLTGTINDIRIIDDYAHHPVEIEAALSSARDALGDSDGRVIAVVQPHRYTRLRDLFDEFCTCFNDADIVIVADVFPAGESPIEGYDAKSLAEGISRHGHKNVQLLSDEHSTDESRLGQLIADISKPNDIVICLGAGSISSWAGALPKKLERLLVKSEVA